MDNESDRQYLPENDFSNNILIMYRVFISPFIDGRRERGERNYHEYLPCFRNCAMNCTYILLCNANKDTAV